MQNSPPNAAAERLVNDDLVNELLDGMEREALNCAIDAHPSDDEQRRVSTTEVRVIRTFREKLKSLSEGSTNFPKGHPVA